jgi:hypothetical protein
LIVAHIEWQKVGRLAGQPRRHPDLFGIDGEVYQRAALEGEDRFALIAVGAVLPPGVFDGLPGERVLKLQRDDRDAVQRDRQI